MKKWHIIFGKFKHPAEAVGVLFLVILGILGIIYSVKAYPETFKTSLRAEKIYDIGPKEPVVIDFTQPIIISSYANQINIFPSEEAGLSWQNNNKKLVITPKNFWKPETQYKISLPEGASIFLTQAEKREIAFQTFKYPKIANFYPAEGAKDVILDIEDPIKASFLQSTKGFTLKFVTNPAAEVVYSSDPEQKDYQILPREKFQEGQQYTVRTLVKYEEENDLSFKEISTNTFETLPPPPEKWETDLTLRADQAKRFTRPQITAGKYIDINLKAQVMTIFENGKALDSYIISSGKRGMDTPVGTYSIHNKAPRVWSKKYGLYMPFWMAVASDGSFGIHELPEWPGGYKEGANHLGIPVSHGCIRLGVGSAKRVYDWTEIGTPVVIR